MPELSLFTLPEGNVQICLSGGRTSAMMLYNLLQANGDDLASNRVKIIFTNTGREREETLFFVREIEERWDLPITWLEYEIRNGKPAARVVNYWTASRKGEPFEAIIRKKKYLPNPATRFCTQELKIRTAKHWLRMNGWENWINAIGFRADETSRIVRSRKADKKDCWTTWSPLQDANISKRDVAQFWRDQDFDLQLPNVNGCTPTGNCDGCFLKSEALRAALARDEPEAFAWWVEMEKLASELASKSSGARFLKNQSYAELGSFVAKQGDWIFDDESALCQADGGECI